jgi:hypothetical protein
MSRGDKSQLEVIQIVPQQKSNGDSELLLNSRIKELESELEDKVSSSKQVQNLKSMLQKKNDEVKALKLRLSKYENVQFDT